MLDTAIVGAGLSGLALASRLHQQGVQCALFEARERIGGRILSLSVDGMMLDMGPAWYWPAIQPRMTHWIKSLGLDTFQQYDQGIVLSITDPDKAAQHYTTEPIHNGAMRLAGGMDSLIQAFAETLPASSIHRSHVLKAVIQRADHVELHFQHAEQLLTILARQVVLTVPPRVLEEQVTFVPPLDEALRQAMRATPTWMAGQAKVLVTYPQPFWRDEGYSGNAFVNHEQAMLYETFDACDAGAEHAALGGFVALSPALRLSFQQGFSLLVSSQLAQLFGSAAENGALTLQDWAVEPYTCSILDQIPLSSHPIYDAPILHKPWWDAKLFFCGTETAGYAAGYMEGALEAGERVSYLLSRRSEMA